MSVETFLDLFTRSQFQVGVVAGVLALFLLGVLAPGRIGWGSAASAAAIVGIQLTVGRRIGVTVGLITLGVGGTLLDRQERDTRAILQLLGWAIIASGAIVTTVRGGLSATPWIQISTPMVVIFTGYWLASWGHLPRRRLLGPLFAITAFGIWSTIPNTDSARVLLGVSLPLVLATLPTSGARISAMGAFPLAGLMAWIAADGGDLRHGSIVGSWACVGLLVLLPMIVGKTEAPRPSLMLFTHALFVLVASRVFGLWETALSAALGVVALVSACYLLLSNLRRHATVIAGQAKQERRDR